MIVCLLFSNFLTISFFLVYFLNILWFIHIQLWSVVHYYFKFPTQKKKNIYIYIHGPPKYKFLTSPLILICSMNYSIRISLKFSRNWNSCGDCRWSCFVVDSSKPIWEREREKICPKQESVSHSSSTISAPLRDLQLTEQVTSTK